MYSDISLFIDGKWTNAAAGRTIPVVNPATGEDIGVVAHADKSDLDRALEAADKGFRTWRKISAFDRSKIMRKAANLLRERADAIAPLLTLEQGKPVAEAKGETLAGADVIDWFAEEARRAYGRVIRLAPRVSTNSSSRNRSARSRPSRRGISRSIRWCANCPARLLPGARSSSKRRRKLQPHRRS
jgi:acyl-CoA reductase-like NAD-dependent aldehyde dehydrogenase